ncbi:MAG: rhodanese-like domain-containing protein [Coriobacteriaceae bacterium]|jgi:rhodanese-related sulfurtransferase|nr:rhodanese-like domain-containing protein [Coriobacteriaceae bacterium]
MLNSILNFKKQARLSRSLALSAALLLMLGMGLLVGCDNTSTSSNTNTSSSTSASSGEENAGSASYHKISADKAKDMMDSGEPYILIDVRSDEEYQAGHIEGAILIPHNEIKKRASGELTDSDATIFVYCRSGVRSSSAAHELVGQGYTNVYDMGGLMSWPYGTVTN